ncbi:MAG: AI-2E family transporter [Rhodospirillales bacterium]|nr:AI-2E family transporter [Rhodospirillales bacterium]
MTVERRQLIWLGLAVVGAVLIYELRGALPPFIAGMAVAYLLDPLADRLEAVGCPRTAAVLIILGSFLAVLVAAAVLLFPILQVQVVELLARLPDYIQKGRDAIMPMFERLQASLSDAEVERLRSAVGDVAGNILGWLGQIVGGLWSGGLALFNALSLVVIMPVVAFYLLRDWDRIVAHVDGLLPRGAAATIREQVGEIDDRLSGFVRGQALVCLALGTWYAVGLTLVGLDFGVLVGVGAGLISFIPYLGTGLGLVVGFGLALAQFDSWLPIGLVAAVFATGQILEGYVLTPRLVGQRVGLHPVWVLFALMAGGALLGFTGVLLAVPAAAVIGVLVRFAIARYLQSPLYRSRSGEPADGGGDAAAERSEAVADRE